MALLLKGLKRIDRKLVQERLVPVGMVVGFALFVTVIMWRTGSVKQKLGQVKDSIRLASQNVARLPLLKEQEEELSKRISDTRVSVFTETELGDFIGEVSELARTHNVQIASSRPSPLNDYGDPILHTTYEPYQYELELESDFHGLGMLLAKLYQLPKLFRIKNITVLGTESADHFNRISLTFLVVGAKKIAHEG